MRGYPRPVAERASTSPMRVAVVAGIFGIVAGLLPAAISGYFAVSLHRENQDLTRALADEADADSPAPRLDPELLHVALTEGRDALLLRMRVSNQGETTARGCLVVESSELDTLMSVPEMDHPLFFAPPADRPDALDRFEVEPGATVEGTVLVIQTEDGHRVDTPPRSNWILVAEVACVTPDATTGLVAAVLRPDNGEVVFEVHSGAEDPAFDG